jgi:CHRD domain-containing protein
MTSRWILPFCVVAALGFGVAPASAQQYTLTATLSGAGETPAPGLLTGAFGSATVVVDLTARTVSYTVTVYNLPSGVTASHIHVGAVGNAGPVVVNFAPPLTASNDFSFTGVVRDTEFALQPALGIRSADDMFQAIIGGNSYVNVHSSVNPGGEIRGQLILRQP